MFDVRVRQFHFHPQTHSKKKKTKLGIATPKISVQRFVVLGRGFNIGGGGRRGVSTIETTCLATEDGNRACENLWLVVRRSRSAWDLNVLH